MIGPNILQGIKCEHPVSLIDLYPTLTDICGLHDKPHKDTNKRTLDGFSLRPLSLKGQDGKWAGPAGALSVIASIDNLAMGDPGKKER